VSWTWSDARAALILAVLVPNLIYGLPVPSAAKPEQMETPMRKREVAEWTAAANRLGLDITPDEMAAFTVEATGFAAGIHNALKAPFRPLSRITGTNQRWPLFAAATTTPTRLTVEAKRADGSTEVLFRRLDPEHTWHAEVFRYRRVRGIYDIVGTKRPPGYKPLTRTIAGWAFAEDPTITEVTVYLRRVPLTFPWEEPVREGPVLHRRRIRRDP